MTITSTERARHYVLSELQLTGNTGKIDSDSLAWLEPLDASASDEEIRHELATKGVVHLKNVMPRDYVQTARKRYFDHVASTGMLKEGSDPTDGIWCGDKEPTDFVGLDNQKYIIGEGEANPTQAEYMRLSLEAVHADWAEEFCGNKYIRDAVMRIRNTWTDPFVMRRQIWRANIPGAKGVSTGVHYDHIFLRGGPPTAITAWVPVGDCDPTMGGLIYLEKSMPVGERIEEAFTRECQEKGMTEDETRSAFNQNMMNNGMLSTDPGAFCKRQGEGRRWLVGNYEAGDVVFHHSYMIHASSGNTDPHGRIRLSADLRYGDRRHEYDARWDADVFLPNDGL